MAYFDDLTSYSYSERFAKPGLLNVGWLDRNHPFSIGVTPQVFRDRLFAFAMVSIAQTRGFHCCDLCQDNKELITLRGLKLGSAEIRVFGDGVQFASPNLIVHYVEEHGYKPPATFVDAVLSRPCPPDAAYFKALECEGLVWRTCLGRINSLD